MLDGSLIADVLPRRVRAATLEDLPQILALGERMRAESLIAFDPIEPAVAERMLGIIVAHPDRFMAAVAEDSGGRICGFLTAFATETSWSSRLCAIHDIFFVAPERRGSLAASDLVDHFHAWARRIGCRRTIMAVHTKLYLERTGRFYEKKGYTHIGGVYMQELN